jgi:hypothetical protein
MFLEPSTKGFTVTIGGKAGGSQVDFDFGQVQPIVACGFSVGSVLELLLGMHS